MSLRINLSLEEVEMSQCMLLFSSLGHFGEAKHTNRSIKCIRFPHSRSTAKFGKVQLDKINKK